MIIKQRWGVLANLSSTGIVIGILAIVIFVGLFSWILIDIYSTEATVSGKVIKVVYKDAMFIRRTEITFEHLGTLLFTLTDYNFEIGKVYDITYRGSIPYGVIINVELVE